MNDDLNDQSLWNNPAIEETIKRTDPEKYYKYQKMAQSLFDKSNIDDPHIINIEAATQIRLMLRDGLHPSLLDENEKDLFISTFGQESFDAFNGPGCNDKFLTQPPTQPISTPPPTPTRASVSTLGSTGCFDPKALMSQKIAHSAAKKRPRSGTLSHNEQIASKRVVFLKQ